VDILKSGGIVSLVIKNNWTGHQTLSPPGSWISRHRFSWIGWISRYLFWTEWTYL